MTILIINNQVGNEGDSQSGQGSTWLLIDSIHYPATEGMVIQ